MGAKGKGMAVTVRTRRFSVPEYHQMARAGILKEDDTVELVEGEVLEMTPTGPRHAVCVSRLNHRLTVTLTGRAIVSVQSLVQLSPYSEPQPELALLRPPFARYTDAHPGPEDLFLVIEVADTTIDDDRARKVPLYARAGIRETWLVNLRDEAVEVYRQPTQEGYRDVLTLRRGQSLAPEAFPDRVLAVDDILG